MLKKLEKMYYDMNNKPGYLESLTKEFISYLNNKYEINVYEKDINYVYVNKETSFSIKNKSVNNILDGDYKIDIKSKETYDISSYHNNPFVNDNLNETGFSF